MRKSLFFGMLVLMLVTAFSITSCDSTDEYNNYYVDLADGAVIFINNSNAEIEVTITSPIYESFTLASGKQKTVKKPYRVLFMVKSNGDEVRIVIESGIVNFWDK